MRTSVVIACIAASVSMIAVASAAPPPSTARLMQANVSLFDLFVQTMEDALDSARVSLHSEEVPLLWKIEYDGKKDLLVFTFTRTLKGEEAKSFLKQPVARRKELMSASVKELAPVIGLTPPEGLSEPTGLLQIAPVRAQTAELREAAEKMRKELRERGLVVLTWQAESLLCVTGLAADGKLEYSETSTKGGSRP